MFSQELKSERLTQFFGETLTQKELDECLAVAEIIEPPPAKQFWNARESQPGIYMILAGKVRLLDDSNNLITTITVGMSFGELTLFSEHQFIPYTARSSVNLKLLFLKQEVLQLKMRQHPNLEARIKRNAELLDLTLSFRLRPGGSTDAEEMHKALSLFDRHVFEAPSQIPIPADAEMLIIWQGEILNSNGNKLTNGNLYTIEQNENWQATQPSIAYILKSSNVKTASSHWSSLNQLKSDYKTERQDSQYSAPNIIQFPHTAQTKRPKRQAYFPSPTLTLGHWWGRLIKRYPIFEQQSASDCGAACLIMISRYWGKRLSVNRVRDLTNISRSGASLKGLAFCAESLGYTTRPVKASLDKLAQQPLPAIVHWEGKHYIVVYEITKKQVFVGDPAIGQRNLTVADFKAGWTGYALLLEPTVQLQETTETSTPFWRLFELVRPHTVVLLEVFAASLLIQIFGLVTPLFTQLLLDRVIVQGSTLTLNAVGFGLLIFGLFRVALNGLRQYLLDHTANRVGVALMVGFIKHTFRLPLAFFESRYVGDIVSRVQENQKIQRFLTGEALSICLDLMTVFIYVGLMFWYSWQMALLCLTIVPPFFLLTLLATPFLRRISKEVFTALASENSYLIQSLSGISSIRSMAIEQTVRWHWEEQLNNLVKKTFTGQVISNQLQVFSATIQSLVTTGLLWFGAWQVIQNQLTIGQLVAFNMLLGNIIQPFQRLIVLWNQLQEVIVSTERINDVLEAEPEEDLQASPRQFLDKLHGSIRFDNVTFRYHPESDINVLENLSFEIKPQQTVAVVGRSGSGKTTLSKLILGLYKPTDGKVLIDAQDITTISLSALRSQIGVVNQDTFLFGGTIRENISIAHPEANLEEIAEVARLAGADEFIKRLPMGYETQIGEGGGMLSGGQRQRLAIARALLGNPRLLLLDEATSHLDSESERIIQKNLKTILKGRTSLIIAHRLSTVRNADLILVLANGVLVESGTHNQLIAKKGHYFYLNQQQLQEC
ncbi:ABC transporter ATP-binding protein [Calothrix sp. NIES-4071]|nr:ABC transporter ATP-binding protein [Calothrix sp. NIES-4071]BAZ59650.1 ABC transporter ATP-binding protein [Calothrix sp. NIES-4105]